MRHAPAASLKLAGLGLLASTMLCGSGAAFAQRRRRPPPATGAAASDRRRARRTRPTSSSPRQKRAENLQDVPIAITALGTEKLDELQVDDFDDYARLVPSISFQIARARASPTSISAASPRARTPTIRPRCRSVGTYLDEQPITTITGALDLHIFDIARVEALAGPQGTLYGASSQAGTVRIITNRPDTSASTARPMSS